jgi:hypothetical protein
MIDVFGEIVIRIVGSVLSGAVDVVLGARRVDPDDEGPLVTPNQLAERRYAYRRWAEKRGYARDARWSDLFRGEQSGRRIRFYTGVAGSRPRPPELFVEVAGVSVDSTIILEPEKPAPAEVDPAITAVLQRDGVLQIDLSPKGVRILYVAMVPVDLLEPPLEEILRALAPRTTTAYR